MNIGILLRRAPCTASRELNFLACQFAIVIRIRRAGATRAVNHRNVLSVKYFPATNHFRRTLKNQAARVSSAMRYRLNCKRFLANGLISIIEVELKI